MLRGRVPPCARPRLEPFVGFSCSLLLLVASCTLMGWGRPAARGRIGPTKPCFSVTRSSAAMCANARRLISVNVFGYNLSSDSLKAPGKFQPHLLDLKSVQVVLHGLPLILFNIEEIIRKPSGGFVDKVLFPEQRRKLVKGGGDMFVGKANEPFQRRACQRAHEQLAVHNVRSSCKHHLCVGIWVLYSCEGDLRAQRRGR